jgi:muramoyltetrapeptide carboxypeptidase
MKPAARAKPSLKPRRIKKGDTLSLVAPSGAASSPERVEASIKALEALGYRVKASPHCADRNGYLAGEDSIRAAELLSAFEDPDTTGVVCLKGGYGTPRILDRLDYGIIARHPKFFMGYSDITGLHLAFAKETGLVTFHGPMASSDMVPEIHPETKTAFESAMAGRLHLRAAELVDPAAGRLIEGPLTGGNLSLIAATMGTPWEIDTRGKIIFLEDIDEAPYRIDRMLTQLRLAGKFDDCAGVVLGAWTRCEAGEGKPTLSIGEIIREIVAGHGKPVLAGLPAGHCSPTLTLPMGVRYRLDPDARTLEMVESPFLEDF